MLIVLLQHNVATQLLHDLVGNPESKAMPAFTERRERLVKMRHLFGGQLLSIIFDEHAQDAVMFTNGADDMAFLIGRLNGIEQQIDQDLSHLIGG